MLRSRSINIYRRLSTKPDFDVIVIGGGHAGCESAAAAARCNSRTLLLTHNKGTIGEMSCNPSFGGIGKGHLIREVDALDGLCGRICDKSAITYQALNRGQGPAVLGLRAQIDRKLYKKFMQEEMFNMKNLEIFEGEVEELQLHHSGKKINSVTLSDGKCFSTETVVITTGTFLGGEIYQGMKTWPAGRINEKSSMGLSKSFSKLGFELGRLRTGTPPRLMKNTIDFSKFELMAPDKTPIPFSFLTDQVWLSPEQQLPTYLGHTTDDVTRIAQEHFKENLQVLSETTSPRYCPSLESKLKRFPQLKHRMFLEHEGLDSDHIYPQGMSMTFAPVVQLKMMRAIPGLERVEFVQAGYGVQYDFVNPQQLKNTLETRKVQGIFLAGQINGTTGYEEAAAQGVVAGMNAAARAQNREMMSLGRADAYIGVLIDDLTSLGTMEPYRMLTSRAEFRLHLRPDNADLRLTETGRSHGAVRDVRWNRFIEMKRRLDDVRAELKGASKSVAQWKKLLPRLETKSDYKVLSAFDLVHRHNVSLTELASISSLSDHEHDIYERLKIEGSYELEQKRMEVKRREIESESALEIPDEVDYSKMRGLSLECVEKLERHRPRNLAAVTRISGITPEAVVVLLRNLQKPTKKVKRELLQ